MAPDYSRPNGHRPDLLLLPPLITNLGRPVGFERPDKCAQAMIRHVGWVVHKKETAVQTRPCSSGQISCGPDARERASTAEKGDC
ncbi:unnamed protein product [Bursaphelenchus xylophilus]|uniref:(pine wood nematode) hypothetical protein n=1 Tax=Bursaphelenchus xylophilus TaxID=6326 RepID=A0A1I7S2X7_BURXY|nr:unnamed protein product [Bursaphelenchus xylophilus]CAG9116020.1 unnamed protein product [Bursaphelenchus xylophilus]